MSSSRISPTAAGTRTPESVRGCSRELFSGFLAGVRVLGGCQGAIELLRELRPDFRHGFQDVLRLQQLFLATGVDHRCEYCGLEVVPFRGQRL